MPILKDKQKTFTILSMKKRIVPFVLTLLAATALTSCDFSSLINPESSSNYTYYDLGQHSNEGTFFGKSVGNAKTLVVPVIIGGYEENATEVTRNRINKAFFGTSEDTGWESVSSYFKKCSYGKYNLTGEVTEWFDSKINYSSLQYYSTEYGDLGTFKIVDLVYKWLTDVKKMDLSSYDVDGDGFIDSLCLIYSCPHVKNNSSDSPYWAFTFWDYEYIDSVRSKTKPIPNTYLWASYDFMDGASSLGLKIDTHTYIHEYGHCLGLEDYYDYDLEHSPIGGIDMQDWNIGDHNAFSKLAFGWVNPKVVSKPCTIEIKPTSTSGDCIIIKNPNNAWKGSPFDEYLLLDFVAQDNLWIQDTEHTYTNNLKSYSIPGIRIYHVDARLARVDIKTQKVMEITDKILPGNRYNVARSNTPSRSLYQGSVNPHTGKTLYQDLISIVNKDHDYRTTYNYQKTGTNNDLFVTGNTFRCDSYLEFFIDGKMNDGSKIPFTINFKSVTKDKAVIEISKD